MPSKYWDKIAKRRPAYASIFASKSLDIIDQIHFLLREKSWTQKDLAKALGKSESEISKWLSAGHNLTIKTLAKIEAELGTDVLQTPLRHQALDAASATGMKHAAAYRQTIQSFEMELDHENDPFPLTGSTVSPPEIDFSIWSDKASTSKQSDIKLEEQQGAEVDAAESENAEANYAMAA